MACYETVPIYDNTGAKRGSYQKEVPCPETGSTQTEEPKSKPKKTTNKYGGPVGTKRDAKGRSYSEHSGTGKTTRNKRSSEKTTGESSVDAQAVAERKAAVDRAARKAARKAAREAAEQAIREEVQRKAKKRGAKIQAQLQARKDAIAAAAEANQKKLQSIDQAIATAAKSGNRETAATLAEQRMGLVRQQSYLNKKAIEAKSGVNRIRAGSEFRKAIDDIRANTALDDVQKRRRLRKLKAERRNEKRDAIQESALSSVAKVEYGKKRPGQAGYGKVLKKAIADVTSLQVSNPDEFDPDLLTDLGEYLVRHEKKVAANYDKFVKGYEADIELLDPKSKKAAKPGSQKWRRARNRMLRRFDEYDMEEQRREFDQLYGPDPRTNIKGTKVPRPGKQGLFNYFSTAADEAYNAAEKRQREILFGTGIAGAMNELGSGVQAALLTARAESTRRNVEDPPGSGKYRKQTRQERLNEMFREGSMSQEEAEEIGQNQYRDFVAESLAVQDSPTLPHLYDLFEEEGIKDNSDLTGVFDIEKLESHLIPEAQQRAWEAHKKSDDYRVPGEAEGIFDADRYGRGADGEEYFLLADGTEVRLGDPLPEGHPTPLWGHQEDVGLSTQVARAASWLIPPLGLGLFATGQINITDTYSRAYDHAKSQYEENWKQRAEDDFRATLRIDDPGFIGDIFRHNVAGEIISTFDLVPGSVALAWENYNQAKTGLNRPEGHDKPIQDAAEFRTYIEENADLFADDEYYFRANTSEQGDIVGDFFNAIGFSASKYLGIDEETNRVTAGILVSVPVVGPMEFIWELGDAADAERAERNEAAQKSFEALMEGDFGVAARVLGTNEVFQFGNMAGLANFAFYLVADPSNIIPGITLGKKGLAGVRAALAAGKNVPPGVGKLARLTAGFKGGVAGFRQDIKAAEAIVRTVENIESLGVAPNRTEVLAGLQRLRAGIDDKATGDALIKEIAKGLNEQFGLNRLGLDSAQINQLAQESAGAIMGKMGWLVYTQADEAAAQITRMEETVDLVLGEVRAIDDEIAARNARAIQVLSREGAEARRDASRLRKASEDFDSTALDLANKMSEASLERQARNATTADARRLYQRALELKRQRGAGPASPTEQFGKVAHDDSVQRVKGEYEAEQQLKAAKKRAVRGAKGKDKKLLRDAELRARDEELRIQREERLRTQKIERDIAAEGEKVQRYEAQQVAIRERRPVDRIGRALESETVKRYFSRVIPDSWSKPDGPKFWVPMVSKGTQPTTGNLAAKQALEYVQGVIARHGRFFAADEAAKPLVDRLVAQYFANPAALREHLWQVAKRQSPQFYDVPGFGLNKAGTKVTRVGADPDAGLQFYVTLGPGGNQTFDSVASVAEHIAKEGPGILLDSPSQLNYVLRSMLQFGAEGLTKRDYAQIFLIRQQFFSATSEEAIWFLKRVGDDPSMQLLVREMFADELNDWRNVFGDYGLVIDSDIYKQLGEDTPIARLAAYLEPPLKRNEEFFAQGNFAMRPGSPVVGYEGYDVDAAFKALDEALSTSNDLGPQQARTLDTLVRAALYQSLSAHDYDLVRTLSRTLAGAGNQTKAGRLARAMRQRMFRELEIMGIDPQDIQYRQVVSELEPLKEGEIRVFRGYDASAGKGPLTAYSSGGTGNRVFGQGLYTSPKYDYAASYAAFYHYERNGMYSQVTAFRTADDVVMDLRPFVGNVTDDVEDILRRAGTKGSNAAEVPSEGEVRAAERMNQFLGWLRRKLEEGERVANGGELTPNQIANIDAEVKRLTINQLFGQDSQFNGYRSAMDEFVDEQGLKGFNYDSGLWKIPEGGTGTVPGEAAILFRDIEGLQIEALNAVDNAPPRPQEVAVRQAKALMNEMGMSEEAWLRNRIARNEKLRNNPKTSNVEAARLSRENALMERALLDIRVQKSGKGYTPPAIAFNEAVQLAQSAAPRVAGRVPPKMFAFFARNAEQARVETARAVYQASRETPTNGATIKPIEEFLDNWDMARYDDLNARVTQEIQQVQDTRRAKLGERKVNTDEKPDDFLQSLSDKDPEVLAAKRRALQAYADATGTPVVSVAMYDRMRTLLQGHIQRGVRARAIADEAEALARQTGRDFDEVFLELRQAKVDADAVQTIRQMLLRHPGMTLDEAVRHFELSYIQDGILRKPRKQITLSDKRILESYFEAKTGARVSNQQSVIDALAAADTKPDFKSRALFREEAVRKGDWSPRKASEIDVERPTWSIDEEREFFMNRYGEAPRWTTDPRLAPGGDAFMSREIMYRTMVETGNYDETLRVRRALGEQSYSDYDDLAFGKKGPDGEWVVKPAKDVERERLWLVQRYGDRVGTLNQDGTVTLTAAPWLMNREELKVFMRNIPDTKRGLLGDIIRNDDELAEVQAAIDRIAEKHVKAWVRSTGIVDAAEMAVPSSVVHRMAFDIVREVAATTPWRSFYKHLRNRNFIDAWGWFWRAVVVSNPAFVVSNIIDTPTKAIWFSLTNRWAGKTAKWAIDDIPDVHALGIENTAYFNDAGGRRIIDRLRPGTSYGNLDRASALADVFATGLAKATLQPVERAVKTRLARQIYTGLWEELGPGLMKTHKGDRDIVKELLLLETRREILRLFPTLDTAGPTERFINKLMPFISYNFKNRVLWMSEVVEHPWLLYVIEEAQGAWIEMNKTLWENEHPGERMPEWLFDKIRIPGTDMFVDLGMFTDSARGAELLFGSASNVGEVLSTLIRPLPSQRAALNHLLYQMFNIGGRWRYERVIGEDGTWDGTSFRRVQIPPGTPWGEKPLDVVADFVWTAGFIGQIQESLKDGSMTYAEFVRTMGTLISFGEFAEPSRYFMTVQKYFALPDQDARNAFLETEEGQWLKSQWDAAYWEPTDTAASPFAFNYEEGAPTPEAVRKRWLMQQPPETRERFFRLWNEAEALGEYWDAKIDAAPAKERERLWAMRRTQFAQFYHENPTLWQYSAMGLPPDEFNKMLGKRRLDELREVFFDTFGYDKAPTDPKERAAWEQDRIAWLEANPDLRADLEAVKDSYDRSVRDRNDRWDKLIRLSKASNRVRDLAYKRDDETLVEAVDGLREVISDGFKMEAFGYDKDRQQWRTKADALTSKLRKAAGDPEATQDALFALRMEAVWEKAGDDPLKFHNILDRHKDLRQMYFARNPDKALTWKKDGEYLEFWGRMGRLADRGRWDQYWDSWDASPQWVKDRFQSNNPSKFRKFVQSARYSDYMGRWVGMFDTHGAKAAMEYFYSLPQWAQDRYYANHPGKSFSPSGGRGFEYVSMLNGMFDQIDAGNWDAAERIWNNAPAWMRRRYYHNNPDSTLFRGGSGGGSRGSGGGISDAKYKQYVQGMKQWVALLRDGKDEAAIKYFKSLPQWMQDFYVRNNPDKALIKEDLKMQALLEDYFLADKAHQNAMLENHPRLAKWLNENDTVGARRRAIQYLYSQLPDDPWLKRVYREKYPEVFGDEAVGRQRRRAVAETLADHPEFRESWEKWLEDIYATLQEAMKYMTARPKSPEVDWEYFRSRRAAKGRSAEELSEIVEDYDRREWKLNARAPKGDG